MFRFFCKDFLYQKSRENELNLGTWIQKNFMPKQLSKEIGKKRSIWLIPA